jgi:hypothetical protein
LPYDIERKCGIFGISFSLSLSFCFAPGSGNVAFYPTVRQNTVALGLSLQAVMLMEILVTFELEIGHSDREQHSARLESMR